MIGQSCQRATSITSFLGNEKERQAKWKLTEFKRNQIFWGPVVIFRSLLTSLNIIFIWAAWQGLYVLEEATFSQQETKSKWSSQMQVHSNRRDLFTLKCEQWAKKAEAVYFHLLPPSLTTFSLPCSYANKFIRGPRRRCSLAFNELYCLLLKIWGTFLLCWLCTIRAGCL